MRSVIIDCIEEELVSYADDEEQKIQENVEDFIRKEENCLNEIAFFFAHSRT